MMEIVDRQERQPKFQIFLILLWNMALSSFLLCLSPHRHGNDHCHQDGVFATGAFDVEIGRGAGADMQGTLGLAMSKKYVLMLEQSLFHRAIRG